jgi:hypothetical protein
MPTSKKRGGKKAHNKRVTKRNKNLTNAQQRYEKMLAKVMEHQLNQLNPEENGASESEETPAS